MSSAPRPKVRARTGLAWRSWGDESVVFNPESGQTHLLDLVSREGLWCLQDAALDVGELCDRVAERLDNEPDHQLVQYIENLVSQFDELGLIENVEGTES